LPLADAETSRMGWLTLDSEVHSLLGKTDIILAISRVTNTVIENHRSTLETRGGELSQLGKVLPRH
jgi:hypothetical protein